MTEPERHLIVGPPGAGKTHLELEYAESELVAGLDPAKLGLVTFTVTEHAM